MNDSQSTNTIDLAGWLIVINWGIRVNGWLVVSSCLQCLSIGLSWLIMVDSPLSWLSMLVSHGKCRTIMLILCFPSLTLRHDS